MKDNPYDKSPPPQCEGCTMYGDCGIFPPHDNCHKYFICESCGKHYLKCMCEGEDRESDAKELVFDCAVDVKKDAKYKGFAYVVRREVMERLIAALEYHDKVTSV